MTRPPRCPTCDRGLDFVDDTGVRAWTCPRCLGTAATLGLLREHLDGARAGELTASVAAASATSTRCCPACAERMSTFTCGAGGVEVELDACRACALVWFDHAELEQVNVHLGQPTTAPTTAESASPNVDPAKRSVEADAGYAGHAFGVVLDVIAFLLT